LEERAPASGKGTIWYRPVHDEGGNVDLLQVFGEVSAEWKNWSPDFGVPWYVDAVGHILQ
jgi:hypothetical protein